MITEPSQFSLIPRLLPVQFFGCMYSVADKRIEPGNEVKSVGNMTATTIMSALSEKPCNRLAAETIKKLTKKED